MSAQAGMPPFYEQQYPQSTEIEAALFELGRIGLDVEPTSALAAAAFTKLQERGVIRPGETTVLVLTRGGLKAPRRIGELTGALPRRKRRPGVRRRSRPPMQTRVRALRHRRALTLSGDACYGRLRSRFCCSVVSLSSSLRRGLDLGRGLRDRHDVSLRRPDRHRGCRCRIDQARSSRFPWNRVRDAAFSGGGLGGEATHST